ncbi:MAG TPA: hypothetical protein ENK17_02450, partial [Anaerolineae bacterium]|nr:hypothetical protein [Anaerolineae bacterium]
TATDISSLEKAMRLVNKRLARGGEVVVLDPLPAFPTEDELEEKGTTGAKRSVQGSRVLDAGIAVASSWLRRKPGMLIIVNQLRFDHGVVFGNPRKPYLGDVTQNFPVLLDVRRWEAIKQNGAQVGGKYRFRVKKHVGGVPWQWAVFDIYTGTGPVRETAQPRSLPLPREVQMAGSEQGDKVIPIYRARG